MIAPRQTFESIIVRMEELASKECPTCAGQRALFDPFRCCPECGGWGRVVPLEDKEEYERLRALGKAIIR